MSGHVAHLAGAYLDGGLDAADTTAFEAHVSVCPDCARVLRELREAIRTLGDRPPEPLERSARDRLLEAYRAWRSGR